MNKVLVLGATGATGSLLVERLLESSIEVVAIVRSKSRVSGNISGKIELIEGDISSLSDQQLKPVLEGCSACLSCLGHHLTFKGLFGQPRMLVTDTVSKVLRVAKALERKPFKFVLMSSSGVQNHLFLERPPFSQKCVVSMLRILVPPHYDNEQAAARLVNDTLSDKLSLEWVAVRPDTLTNQPGVSAFELRDSPVRNVIFNAGRTSRTNVAEFMTLLLTDQNLWDRWKGRMPVIYDAESLSE